MFTCMLWRYVAFTVLLVAWPLGGHWQHQWTEVKSLPSGALPILATFGGRVLEIKAWSGSVDIIGLAETLFVHCWLCEDVHSPFGSRAGACPRVAEHSSGFPHLSWVEGARLVLMPTAAACNANWSAKDNIWFCISLLLNVVEKWLHFVAKQFVSDLLEFASAFSAVSVIMLFSVYARDLLPPPPPHFPLDFFLVSIPPKMCCSCLEFGLPRVLPCWFALHQWKAGKDGLMMYLIPMPHILWVCCCTWSLTPLVSLV